MTATDSSTQGVLDVDGCPLSFRVRGEGEAVVLIQGVGVEGDAWRPQVDALAARFRCLTFDNRGMGKSVPSAGALSIERMTADTVALLDHLQWKSAHVVGHSLGGQVAIELGLSARQRVRSLALLCTFARGRDAVAMTPAKIWTGLRTYIGSRRARRHAFLEMVCPASTLRAADGAAKDRLAADLAELFGHDLADHPAVEMAQLKALKAYDAWTRLPQLAGIPTLVVAAAEDRIAVPASGRNLTAAIPGAHFVEIPDAAHGVPIQKSAEVNRLLVDHFALL
ncbi:MAG: alpha/beta fold hydrolase [Thermoanaerobaculia bacterium]